jgi:hypothetical protein
LNLLMPYLKVLGERFLKQFYERRRKATKFEK